MFETPIHVELCLQRPLAFNGLCFICIQTSNWQLDSIFINITQDNYWFGLACRCLDFPPTPDGGIPMESWFDMSSTFYFWDIRRVRNIILLLFPVKHCSSNARLTFTFTFPFKLYLWIVLCISVFWNVHWMSAAVQSHILAPCYHMSPRRAVTCPHVPAVCCHVFPFWITLWISFEIEL